MMSVQDDKIAKELVIQVLNNELFQQHIKRNVLPKMPMIRPYDVNNDKSVEQWKSDSYRLEGFKLCFMHLFGTDIDKLKGDK